MQWIANPHSPVRLGVARPDSPPVVQLDRTSVFYTDQWPFDPAPGVHIDQRFYGGLSLKVELQDVTLEGANSNFVDHPNTRARLAKLVRRNLLKRDRPRGHVGSKPTVGHQHFSP